MSSVSIISLLEDPDIIIASGKRVFSKEESGAFLSLSETVEKLNAIKNNREEQLKIAEDQARQSGREDGLAQGREEARQELAEKLLELEQHNLTQHTAIRDDVVAIALQVVRKIAAGVAPEDMLVALASGAAAEHLPHQAVSLKVHPEHLDTVKERISRIKDVSSPSMIETIVADNELGPADCILETSVGQVCADLETQLLAFEQHLSTTRAPQESVNITQ